MGHHPGPVGRDRQTDCARADLVLLAGVFGNTRDDHVHQTIAALPMLCAHGAWVIWTRHRNDPDLTPTIRDWFEQAGFVERAFTAPEDAKFTVGVHKLAGTPQRGTRPTRCSSTSANPT
jgi:hypothetical protein